MAEGDAEEAKNTQEKSEAEPSTTDTKPKKRAPKASPDKTEGTADSDKKAKAESEKTNPEGTTEPNKKAKAETENKNPEDAAEPTKKTDAPKEKPEQNQEGAAKEKKPKPQKPKQESEGSAGAKKTKPEGEQKKEEPEAGAPKKKGLFSKLFEKLKRHPKDAEKKDGETKPQGDAAEKKEGGPKATPQDAAEKKESIFKRLFKKKPQKEEPQISLAPTIVSSNISAPADSQAQQQERPVTATVAPVPQQSFAQKLKGLFKKDLPEPIEVPTHCAVCGIDLHTVYSYTCTNCRKIACYYCMRSFNEKTYCTKCLKEKGIL